MTSQKALKPGSVSPKSAKRGVEPNGTLKRIAYLTYARMDRGGGSYVLIKRGLHGPSGEIAIGPMALISEAKAIELAQKLKDRLAEGIDIFQERRDKKKHAVTVGWCMDEFWKLHEPSLKNAKHKYQWTMAKPVW